MILRTKKFFFSKVLVILNSGEAKEVARERRKFDFIEIVSLERLELRDFKVREKTTGVIDLRRTEEELLASFGYESRHKIRKSEEVDGLRFVSEDSNFDEAYAMYREFQKARGEKPYPRLRFKGSLLFSAYVRDRMISAVFVYPSQPCLRVNFIFSARYVENNKEIYRVISIASRRVIFEICRWGMRQARTGLDLASINMNDKAKSGLREFKTSFTPEIVPEYTYVYAGKRYRYFEKLNSRVRYILRGRRP